MYKRCGLYVFFLLLFLSFQIHSETDNNKGFWHKVKWGETIVTLAKKYNVNPYLLAGVNNIKDWNYIWAGDNLWIPFENSKKYLSYTVKKNDHLLAIAHETGVSVWLIAEFNGIFNLNDIYPGQELIIPLQ